MSLVLNSSNDTLLQGFFDLQTPQDVADLLDVKYSTLMYYLYGRGITNQYIRFEIPKKKGGVRTISAPISRLKIIQAKLNQVLLAVYKPKKQVHSFVINKNILSNARTHLKKNVILHIDLLDFFPSIHFGRVMGMFMAKPYYRNKGVAKTLARISALPTELPQGAPSSPIISNMICGQLDSQLLRLADGVKCFYTRYADDISISTYRLILPETIAIVNNGVVELAPSLINIIKGNGFQINESKVRVDNKNRRQSINNITVNRFPNVTKSYWKEIRAMLHAWKKFGLVDAQEEFWNRYDGKHRSQWTNHPSFAKVVKGKIDYLGMIRGKSDPRYLKLMDEYSVLLKIFTRNINIHQINSKNCSRLSTKCKQWKITNAEDTCSRNF